MTSSSSSSSSSCAQTNLAGVVYEELTCLYPFLKPFYASFEVGYDPVPVRDWMVSAPWLPIMAIVLYGLMILIGTPYFAKRNPWNWRRALAFWNFALAAFSAIGFVRVVPQVMHNLMYFSLHDNMCADPEAHYGSGSTGLWVQLFVLSKFPELIDTLFIVVHKKKLIFLHWYHHVTVLLYCWHSYVTSSPTGVFFCAMNYGVHSIMYFYYFLMAIHIKPPWAMLITTLQISQMVVGVILTALGFIYVGSSPQCWISAENNRAAFCMYGSYLALFVQFFVTRYFGGSGKKKTNNTNNTNDGTKKHSKKE